MDVKCERCNTEYEFDDALVSGRGTTVKCTNCGHKFKIRRGDGDYSEDFWNVTTGDGRTLVFTSLRELQRAIQGYLVERNDRLSRGGLPPKAIGQIPELAPFFEQREAAKHGPPGRSVKTHDGLGPSASTAAAQIASNRPRQATKPEFPAPPPDGTPTSSEFGGKSTLIGTGPVTDQPAFSVTPAQPPPVQPAHVRPVSAPPPATERQPERPIHPVPVESAPLPVPKPHVSTPPPVPRRDSMSTVPLKRPTPPPPPPPAPRAISNPPPLPARRSSEPGPLRPSDAAVPVASPRSSDPMVASPAVDVSSPLPPPRAPRSLLADMDEDRGRESAESIPDGPPSRRRSLGGFVVAAVVVGCAALLGVWAQKNLGTTLGGKTPAPAVTVDPRVASFLSAGDKALAEGNLELAKESYDKASALSEKEPHVLLGLARLAAIRADTLWLKARLLPSDATDEQRITRDGLNDLAAGARKAADEALLVAPDDAAALRAKIDASRISGDRDGARALVGKIAASSAQPETAYVLGALDLAEADPLWPTVIERLKVASSAEPGPGRARAARLFALARSGDVPGAKAEVERLSAMTKPHALLPLLRAYADRATSSAKADAGAPIGAVTGAVAPSASADARDPAKGGHRGERGGEKPLPTDSRELLSQGERARARGDYERARTLFNAAVEKNPNDSEALAGLGAIAYAQRDLSGARAAYKRVIAINPNYLPAVVGLADVEWDAGDRATATRMYKDIVDRYPEGAYPGRVKQRAEGGG